MQNKTIEKISKLVGKKFKNKYVVRDEVVSEKIAEPQKSTVVETIITPTPVEHSEPISIEQPTQEPVVTLQDTPFAPVETEEN